MSIRIILDSTTDLPERFRDRVAVVPLTVRFGDEEYIDGVTITKDEFYRRLSLCRELPTTSQASPADFEKVYREITENGDQAVVITVSKTLSGTYQSACIAAEEYPGIFVVDSASVAMGAGILAEYALSKADHYDDAEVFADHLRKKRQDVRILALLDTLDYLVKGGRLSKTVGLVGSLLNIKPVITITGGEIRVLGKARGSKKGNNFLMEQIRLLGVDYHMPILLGYSGESDALLQTYIRDSGVLWENRMEALEQVQIGSVIGTHVGPGAIAVAFFRDPSGEA